MNLNLSRTKDERGIATIELTMFAVAIIAAIYVVIAVVANTLWHPSTHTKVIALIVAIVAMFPLSLAGTAALAWLGDWSSERRRRRDDKTAKTLGPKIKEWLGNPDRSPRPDDLEAWRKAHRSGLSIEEAQHWSDRGISYRTAAAARRLGIRCDQILAIGQALRDGGLWDGKDRTFYDVCVTRPTRHFNDSNPPVALRRWLKFDLTQIVIATAARMALPDVEAAAARDVRIQKRYGGHGPMPAHHRRCGYVHDIFTRLEDPEAWPQIQRRAEGNVQRYQESWN